MLDKTGQKKIFLSSFLIALIFSGMLCGFYAVELSSKTYAYTDETEVIDISRNGPFQYHVSVFGYGGDIDVSFLNQVIALRNQFPVLIPAVARFGDQLYQLAYDQWVQYDYQRRLEEFERNVE